MFDFSASSDAPKGEIYRELREAALALTAGESDGVANMANVAALIWQFLPELNWAGFTARWAMSWCWGHLSASPPASVSLWRACAGRRPRPGKRNWCPTFTLSRPYRLRCGQRFGTGRAGDGRWARGGRD
jgi:hypothetical protein